MSRRITPKTRGLQLEPDDEQEQHHAELGEMQHLLRILDEGQAKGPDRRARHQIADHRAEAEPLEDRHRDHGGAEKDRGTGQKRALAYRHPHSPQPSCFCREGRERTH